jgi:eukaryotic-like serine/threonine-protein kinase
MNAERWQRVDELFQSALLLSPDQRGVFLQEACQNDLALLREVESLLTSHGRAGNFLNGHAMDVAARALATSEAVEFGGSICGRIVSHYRVVKNLGSGGMGSVWLAERNDGRFERRVAVKFLNLAVTGPGSVERFKREGSILGRLSHPNIAELIDAGVSERGEPYLVLEHVEGPRIDEYCNERKLDLEARIRLFLDVLSAVAHAHANLIVHRDIKPSNVLVRQDGQVKLLDFGIAKLLATEELSGAGATTLEGERALTPRFASPEQITGGAITTATDVYALGLLLYLLLSGQHPAGMEEQSPAELVHGILEQEAPKISDAVSRVGAEAAVREAKRRSATPESLRRQLKGDLETITAKALKKNPAERYVSVSSLADDLKRYLRHEPISARSDTLRYRASKFMRRNRKAVALVSFALAAIVAGITGTIIQSRTARKERDFALRELSRANQISNLDQFLLSDAGASNKPILTGELLDREQRIIERENYQNNSGNQVKMLVSLGLQYADREENDQALHVLEEGYRLSMGLHDPSARAQASCALASSVFRAGDPARARALVDEGLRELPQDSLYALDRVFCLLQSTQIAMGGGAAQQAVEEAELAQRVLRTSSIPSKALELRTLTALATANNLAGRSAKAIAAFEKASVVLNDLGYEGTRTAVSFFSEWGLALMLAGNVQEAEKVYRHALDAAGDSPSSQDPGVPMLMTNYADALLNLGRVSEAAEYADRAYATARQIKDQNVIKYILMEQTRIFRVQCDYGRAMAKAAELEPLLRRELQPGHYAFASLASERSMLAECKEDLGTAMRFADEAVTLDRQAVASGGQGAHLLPVLLLRRSKLELELHLPQKAADDADQAVKLAQAALKADTYSSLLGYSYLNLGLALKAGGKLEAARDAFHSAAVQLEKSLGPENHDSRNARKLAESKLD